MAWVVYILECADKTLYTGITNNLPVRRAAHENGTGAKYTKGRGPFILIYEEYAPTRGAASKREVAIKKMTRQKKLDLCACENTNQ
jgi:putative endonuclease